MQKPSKILTGIATSVIIVLGTVFYLHVEKINLFGPTRQPLDDATAKQVLLLDKQNNHATFVFVNDLSDLGTLRNRVIMLPPVGDELRINIDDYLHKGHDGPLYIILPDRYAGPKEKFILKSFPGYKGWYGSMLSDNFVIYAAK